MAGRVGGYPMDETQVAPPGRERTPDPGAAPVAEEGRGDPAAFAAVYRAHYRRIYSYALARTHSEPDAADLTQQTFAQAWAALPAYREQGLPIAAWLFRIARNLIADHYRRRRETVAWEAVPVALRPAVVGDMEAAAERREAVERLRGLLARVDPAKRDLLALRFSGELRMSEIAHVLGRSEGAVKTELRRTLLALREAYDED